MKYEVLTMTHMFDMKKGKYSILSNNDGSLFLWIMEREWLFNQSEISCIPRDEYILEEHNGTIYQNTYALIGDGVGHSADEGKPRYACVFHKSVFPTGLKGCLAPALSIGATGHAIDGVAALEKLLSYIKDKFDKGLGVKILCQ